MKDNNGILKEISGTFTVNEESLEISLKYLKKTGGVLRR